MVSLGDIGNNLSYEFNNVFENIISNKIKHEMAINIKYFDKCLISKLLSGLVLIPPSPSSLLIFSDFNSVNSSNSLIFKDSKLNSKVQEKLEDLISRHEKLSKEYEILTNNNQISENIIPISKELSELADIINPYKEFKKTRGELLEINNLLNDNSADSELKKLAKEEYESTIKQIKHLERFVVSALIPKDLADEGNAVLEVRAGTGGDEAELFAGEIFKMYEKFSLLKHWKFEKLSVSESDEATASILGVGVYGDLKYESGVHRVQRVPITEKAGRIHTSTVTVAILPESTEVDAKLKESDLIIQRYRSSGKGGQHVNTTSSAVRIKHIPTGIVVAIQDEPLRILGAKVYDMERVKLQQERSETRKSQWREIRENKDLQFCSGNKYYIY
nr:13517_t:CDS:2 [Entrophospora candida]